MRLFHGTSSDNAASIIKQGFSLDYLTKGSLGKAIYLSRDFDKCAEYGRHILAVEVDEKCILKDDFLSVSTFTPSTESSHDYTFRSKFKEYTLSKGFKGLELNEFNEIAIYDLSCILSVKIYAIK
ncbi:hypothetical protein MKZ15_06205 [Paenibacillus sp. FSL R7-0216]|uniref:hypothetical protein n=1 Tax=Paenibacillus sp. FSL R7-0216 TaxID=2921677 RepID=UPI0030DA907E